MRPYIPTKPESPLRQLANIITACVDDIEHILDKLHVSYPSLDAPFDPDSKEEEAAMIPDIAHSSALVVAACGQLSATLNVPALTLYDAAGGFHVSSALRVALEGNVVEILRDHPKGLSASGIAAKNGMEPGHLTRVLRHLATHHIFAEASPNVFKNNRLSSMMDSYKSVEEIKQNPVDKHTGAPGIGAMVEHTVDEIFKASAYMAEVMLEPVAEHSENSASSPLVVAFKTNKSAFDWYQETGNERRSNRLAAAMNGFAYLDPSDAILRGFDWKMLPKKSVVVDVGSGVGHITMELLERRHDLTYVLQDRPKVIDDARQFWKENQPHAIIEETVALQAHDIFTSQPVKGAAVYLLRRVLHNYEKEAAAAILRHLRDAADQDSKLLIVEQITRYATVNEAAENPHADVPGVQLWRPPGPLLANLGKASSIATIGDIQMFCGNRGEERTLGTFIELLQDSGWIIVQVFPIPGSLHKQILAEPA
ncbi:O-methyltransferase [Cyathus striatus]|nr:O-methyltransferase [Cyathus striatus]